MHQLRSNLVLLRPVQPNEAASVFEAVRESRETVGKWMSWASATYSLEDAHSWINTCNQERQEGVSHEFGIFDEKYERFLGVAGFNQFNKPNGFGNLGYWIRQSEQRKGYVSAALALLKTYAFETLKLNRVEIVVAVGNEASSAVAVRAGAEFEGVARNRLMLHGTPVNARMYSLVATGA